MTITINEIEYSFADSFSELTIDKYVEFISLVNTPPMERLSKYTGIPIEVINRMQLIQVAMLSDALSFIEQENLLNAVAEPYTGPSVNSCSYRKLIKVKPLLRDSTIIQQGIKIAEIYTGEKLTGTPLLESWGKVSFYMQSLFAFFERFKRLNEHQYTDEELSAGVEQLGIYGDFATIVKIGRERGLKNDEVMEISAEEIYMEMMLDFDRSEYEKRYSELIEHRRKHFESIKQ